MKKIFKLVLSLALVVSLPAFAMAQEAPIISVTVNGAPVTFTEAPPLSQNGRKYVPYGEFFSALGAEAEYDGYSQTVTATRGDTVARFYVGDEYIDVSIDGYDTYVWTDAQTIEQNGVVYVPARFAAQAFGYVVGWDISTRTVIVRDISTLIRESGASYDLMDKRIDFSQKSTESPRAVNGDFGLNLEIYTYEGEEENVVPLNISGTVTGLMDDIGIELALDINTNFSEFMVAISAEDEQADIDDQLAAVLDEFDVDIIVNGDTGTIYARSQLLPYLIGIEDGAWISMDESEFPSLLTTDSLGTMDFEQESVEDALAFYLRYICLYDTDSDTVDALEQINSVVSDEAFVKSGDDYVSSYTMEEDGETVILTLTVNTADGEVSGCSIDITLDEGEDGGMMMEIACGEETVILNITMDIPYALTLDMNMNLTFSETDQTPAREPAEGSTIIPF